MKVHLLLADAAQSDGSGKVGALGLGWSVTSTPTPPHAVLVLLRLGWDETAKPHKLELSLVRADGEPVTLPPASGENPVPLRVEVEFEAVKPADRPKGLDIDHNIAINVGPGLPLDPGGFYEWHLAIDGERDPEWAVPFYVRG